MDWKQTFWKVVKAAAVVGATAIIAWLLGQKDLLNAIGKQPWGFLAIPVLTAVLDWLKHRKD